MKWLNRIAEESFPLKDMLDKLSEYVSAGKLTQEEALEIMRLHDADIQDAVKQAHGAALTGVKERIDVGSPAVPGLK